MRGPAMGRLSVLVMTFAVTTFGCGPSPITANRVETSIETTFANLVQIQVSRLNLPTMPASAFEVTASCRKLVGGDAGSGDWVCSLLWVSPDRQPVRDTYDLFVGTDGCYTATVEGNAIGGPSLTSRDGRSIRNLLFTFEGCFDTT